MPADRPASAIVPDAVGHPAKPYVPDSSISAANERADDADESSGWRAGAPPRPRGAAKDRPAEQLSEVAGQPVPSLEVEQALIWMPEEAAEAASRDRTAENVFHQDLRSTTSELPPVASSGDLEVEATPRSDSHFGRSSRSGPPAREQVSRRKGTPSFGPWELNPEGQPLLPPRLRCEATPEGPVQWLDESYIPPGILPPVEPVIVYRAGRARSGHSASFRAEVEHLRTRLATETLWTKTFVSRVLVEGLTAIDDDATRLGALAITRGDRNDLVVFVVAPGDNLAPRTSQAGDSYTCVVQIDEVVNDTVTFIYCHELTLGPDLDAEAFRRALDRYCHLDDGGPM
ncbi:MAG: hypothetical protein QOF30_1243 [Acidimicrobiaceae bacterium]|jgi:hypothetical protein|nr:hypothetical protein [Acidimicrobiaceae bacterium]